MPRPKGEFSKTSVRLPPVLQQRADALIEFVGQLDGVRAVGFCTRSTVIRYALEIGFEALEREKKKAGK